MDRQHVYSWKSGITIARYLSGEEKYSIDKGAQWKVRYIQAFSEELF